MPEQQPDVDRLAAPPVDAAADDGIPEPPAAVRRLITEDWAATVLGLVLLGLVLVGVITKAMVP